jgi:hypothetical protein
MGISQGGVNFALFSMPENCRYRWSLLSRITRKISLCFNENDPLKGGGWRRRRRVGVPRPNRFRVCGVTPNRPALRVDLPLAGVVESAVVPSYAIALTEGGVSAGLTCS